MVIMYIVNERNIVYIMTASVIPVLLKSLSLIYCFEV